MTYIIITLVLLGYFIIFLIELYTNLTVYNWQHPGKLRESKREPKPEDVRKALLWPLFMLLTLLKSCFYVIGVAPVKFIKLLLLAFKRGTG